MRGKKSAAVPLRLMRAAKRFETWRQSHSVGTRIPKLLWSLAVELAVAYGVSRTAAALRLNYYDLKKRTEAAACESATLNPANNLLPAFIELPSSTLACPMECLIEFENATGSKMRIQLKGTQVPDLVALGVSFWGTHQ